MMPCLAKKRGGSCICDNNNVAKGKRKKCSNYVVPVSKFHGKRKRIKVDPKTGKRKDD